MSSVESEPILPKRNRFPAVSPIVSFVTEMLETPSTNTSNLLIVEEVIVHAMEILYQVPVDKVLPLEPI